MNNAKRKARFTAHEPVHFVIEGKSFGTARQAFYFAKSQREVLCCETTFRARLMTGVDSWERLCAPVDSDPTRKRLATQQRKRDEMAAVIATLDARKAGLS
jgi:hypothetical protein